jgi:hypothetical protein
MSYGRFHQSGFLSDPLSSVIAGLTRHLLNNVLACFQEMADVPPP